MLIRLYLFNTPTAGLRGVYLRNVNIIGPNITLSELSAYLRCGHLGQDRTQDRTETESNVVFICLL